MGGKMSQGCFIPIPCTNILFLSLRELLMPLQSLPCAEVSARLAGGQST